MRDESSPGVDTSDWATILPSGKGPTSAPAQQAPAQQALPPQPAPAARTPAPAFGNPPAYSQPAYGQPAYGQPAMAGAPNAVLNPPPAAYSPGMPNPGFPAMSMPFAAPPKRTNPAIIIVSIVGGIVLVLILIAVAIPVFLSQRKPATVTLTLPASLDGAPQMTTAAAQQATSTIVQGMNDGERAFATGFQAALYSGGSSPGVLVAAGKLTRRPTANDRTQFFQGFERGAAGSASGVSFTKVPPGPLGGTTECGLEITSTPAVMCLSMDNSAIVFVAVYTSDLTEGTMTALQVRSEVEHK